MGLDISLYCIRKDGTILAEDLFDGRNREWFDKMRGYYNDDEYGKLNISYGKPDFLPQSISDYFLDEDGRDWAFDWRYITVGDYIDWYEKYCPQLDAGWCTKRDAWLYEVKGIIPELYYSLSCWGDYASDDAVFITIENTYDCNTYVVNELYDLLRESKIKRDDYIVYCFDN